MPIDNYCYPNSKTLKNKFGIQEEERLFELEREITSRKSFYLKAHPVQGDLDFAHLKAIHRALFSALYEWAGEIRTVDISKGLMFARAIFLEENATEIFHRLKKESFLLYSSKEQLPERLAYYFGELNALHPFREGNGRTQRMFLFYLAKMNGLYLNYAKCEAEEMLEASKISLKFGDNKPFQRLIEKIAEPITEEERRLFLASVHPSWRFEIEETQEEREQY